MTTDYDWPALPGGDVLMQLREAQAALSRVRALAEEWEAQSASGVKVSCGRRLRAAVGGAS